LDKRISDMELHLELVEVVEEESKENFFDEVK
jgi:hypothetical protein